ncbi:AzlD domain-containing protein [Halobacillus sp. Marseille-Q1614]|uniref:AzlD domain-containing protein n=1 Tax=Halobacillus sp. Marseille-Q1614 TaxID=2709134 RepID=UPI00156D4627|nr:AzlD domain-containing protein [Halobacillus sp. Marseille-Q1614]
MIIWIIIGMAAVTAVPRFLPAFIVDKIYFPLWMDRWLNAIPYAALGALIFPGILTVKPDAPQIGIIAAGVAVLLAWMKLNIIIVVMGAIAAVYLMTF